MIKRTLLAAAVAMTFSTNTLAAEGDPVFSKLWTHDHITDGQISEIPAFDHKTNTIWVSGVVGVDVLAADTGELIEHIDVTNYGFVNSVAIYNGLAALAVESPANEDGGDRRFPGNVLLYNTKTRLPANGVNVIEVGALPDMLAFTPDGKRLLVANEGTPNQYADEDYTMPDPVGSVSIIDMRRRSVIATPEPGDASRQTGSALRLPEVTGMDFEPEYIAIDKDGRKAYVTLQEANGVAVLDLKTNQFTNLIGLGLKDFSLADNSFGGDNFIDPTDRDYLSGSSGPTRLEMRPASVLGLYQPDTIATYTVSGKTYLVMANEGDTREDDGDKARAGVLTSDNDLKRLNVSLTESETDNLVTFGGRSFSIRDTAGNLVYDSGSILDREAIERGIYDDGRSDDKGVEPEGVTLLNFHGRTYAFIGLERTTKSAVAVFDITKPRNARFIDMIVTDEDVSPEGLNAYYYKGNAYLAISNEVSNTTSLYQISRSRR